MARLLKKYLHGELASVLDKVDGAVVLHYQGMNAQQEHALRSELRDKHAQLRVVKASITRVYLKDKGFSGEIDDVLRGPVAIITSNNGDGAIGLARSVLQMSKDPKHRKHVKIQGALFDGAVYAADEVDALSRLPTREQLLARLAGAFAAPVQRFASAIYQINARFASVLSAVENKKKEEEGDS